MDLFKELSNPVLHRNTLQKKLSPRHELLSVSPTIANRFSLSLTALRRAIRRRRQTVPLRMRRCARALSSRLELCRRRAILRQLTQGERAEDTGLAVCATCLHAYCLFCTSFAQFYHCLINSALSVVAYMCNCVVHILKVSFKSWIGTTPEF